MAIDRRRDDRRPFMGFSSLHAPAQQRMDALTMAAQRERDSRADAAAKGRDYINRNPWDAQSVMQKFKQQGIDITAGAPGWAPPNAGTLTMEDSLAPFVGNRAQPPAQPKMDIDKLSDEELSAAIERERARLGELATGMVSKNPGNYQGIVDTMHQHGLEIDGSDYTPPPQSPVQIGQGRAQANPQAPNPFARSTGFGPHIPPGLTGNAQANLPPQAAASAPPGAMNQAIDQRSSLTGMAQPNPFGAQGQVPPPGPQGAAAMGPMQAMNPLAAQAQANPMQPPPQAAAQGSINIPMQPDHRMATAFNAAAEQPPVDPAVQQRIAEAARASIPTAAPAQAVPQSPMPARPAGPPGGMPPGGISMPPVQAQANSTMPPPQAQGQASAPPMNPMAIQGQMQANSSMPPGPPPNANAGPMTLPNAGTFPILPGQGSVPPGLQANAATGTFPTDAALTAKMGAQQGPPMPTPPPPGQRVDQAMQFANPPPNPGLEAALRGAIGQTPKGPPPAGYGVPDQIAAAAQAAPPSPPSPPSIPRPRPSQPGDMAQGLPPAPMPAAAPASQSPPPVAPPARPPPAPPSPPMPTMPSPTQQDTSLEIVDYNGSNRVVNRDNKTGKFVSTVGTVAGAALGAAAFGNPVMAAGTGLLGRWAAGRLQNAIGNGMFSGGSSGSFGSGGYGGSGGIYGGPGNYSGGGALGGGYYGSGYGYGGSGIGYGRGGAINPNR